MSLTILHFNRNSVSDISSLSGLTRLTDLNLTYNSISDISVLSEFTELAVLRLYKQPDHGYQHVAGAHEADQSPRSRSA